MVFILEGTTQHDQNEGGSAVPAEVGEEDDEDEATTDDDDGGSADDIDDNEPCEEPMNAPGISKEPSRESRRFPLEVPIPPSPSLP